MYVLAMEVMLVL